MGGRYLNLRLRKIEKTSLKMKNAKWIHFAFFIFTRVGILLKTSKFFIKKLIFYGHYKTFSWVEIQPINYS